MVVSPLFSDVLSCLNDGFLDGECDNALSCPGWISTAESVKKLERFILSVYFPLRHNYVTWAIAQINMFLCMHCSIVGLVSALQCRLP